ncbi:hypothetical protein [Roseicyclus marinus]|uniref:hypothetical protein n=1 Tax=Roseicyclus marinus TaxID=2161673 RepID=UPI0024105530|nr:hypothetical protein [Roseicyclus marinus]MDG3041834.1 hypothetical protein [Roseicyclus marinus]
MRCRLATILACLPLSALPMAGRGLAGPWARPAGEGFLAFSITSDSPTTGLITGDILFDSHAGIYGEYGLGHRLTLGGQIGHSETAEDGVIFLRYTLTPPDATWQFALDTGAGQRIEPGRPDRQLARLGLSVGRGFAGGELPFWPGRTHHGGWVTFDATGLYDTASADVIWAVEGTIGLSLSESLRVLLQAKAEEWPDADTSYALLPGLAYALTNRTTAQIGARLGLGQTETWGIGLGLWHSF